MAQNWPPLEPTSVQNIIPAYPYVEYAYDDNVTAFFEAYTLYAQAYLTWFNELNLPIYTQAPVSGSLLDWVAQGLYGIGRPGLPTSRGDPEQGPINSFTLNSLALNAYRPGLPETYTATSDDYFRRIITWAFWKGDGKVFSIGWLKRRINRFLTGANGTDALTPTTYEVSVVPTGFKTYTITLATTTSSQIFKAAVMAGIMELPFQITWTITLT